MTNETPSPTPHVARVHVKPDTDMGLECQVLCQKSNALRNAALRQIIAFYDRFGDYKIDDITAQEFGLPPLSKPYSGSIWKLGYLYHLLKDTPEFRCGVNTKALKATLESVEEEWKGWCEAWYAWRKCPSKFKAEPRHPKFKSVHGQYKMTYPSDAVSTLLNSGYLPLGGTNIEIPNFKMLSTDKDAPHRLLEVEIQPTCYGYNLNVAYIADLNVSNRGALTSYIQPGDDSRWAGVDLGQSILACIASNHSGVRPIMVGAGHAVWINRRAGYAYSEKQSCLPKGLYDSKNMCRVEQKRDHRMRTLLHTASRRIVDYCLVNGIKHLVCGNNPGWKQKINLGRHGNRRFCKIPFAILRRMLAYKCRNDGIEYVDQEEAHTSKTSFLDNEDICHHKAYAGKRVKRGLFVSADGTQINADVNGALNILRKCAGDVFDSDRKQYAQNPRHIHLQTTLSVVQG